MKFSRRKFLCFAPASIGAFALGAVVLLRSEQPTNHITWVEQAELDWQADMDRWVANNSQMNETYVDLPSSNQVYYFSRRRRVRVDPPHFVVTDGADPSPDYYFFPGDKNYDELRHMVKTRVV